MEPRGDEGAVRGDVAEIRGDQGRSGGDLGQGEIRWRLKGRSDRGGKGVHSRAGLREDGGRVLELPDALGVLRHPLLAEGLAVGVFALALVVLGDVQRSLTVLWRGGTGDTSDAAAGGAGGARGGWGRGR